MESEIKTKPERPISRDALYTDIDTVIDNHGLSAPSADDPACSWIEEIQEQAMRLSEAQRISAGSYREQLLLTAAHLVAALEDLFGDEGNQDLL